MSDFCVKCSEKEGQIEILQQKLYEALELVNELKHENESLILDLAFYENKLDKQS